jgi:hypothetical protein
MQLSTTPLEVTYLRTTSLKPDPRNPRVHSDKQIERDIAHGRGHSKDLINDVLEKIHIRILAYVGRRLETEYLNPPADLSFQCTVTRQHDGHS